MARLTNSDLHNEIKLVKKDIMVYMGSHDRSNCKINILELR
jgi:hypothetical protein